MSASQFQFYLTTRGWIVKAMLATGAMVTALSNLAITRNLSQVKLFILGKDPCPFGRQGSGWPMLTLTPTPEQTGVINIPKELRNPYTLKSTKYNPVINTRIMKWNIWWKVKQFKPSPVNFDPVDHFLTKFLQLPPKRTHCPYLVILTDSLTTNNLVTTHL